MLVLYEQRPRYDNMRFNTTRSVTFLGVFLAMSLVTSNAHAIRYNVEPYVLPRDYAISGGFIETDGTIGQLGVDNITDVSIVVIGPRSHTFGFALGLAGMTASELELVLEPVDDPSPFDVSSLILHDVVGSSCDFGTSHICYTLSYRVGVDGQEVGQPGGTIASVISYEFIEEGCDPLGQGGCIRDFEGGGVVLPDQSRLIIATVPEPSSTILTLTAVVFVAGMRRRQESKRSRRESAEV